LRIFDVIFASPHRTPICNGISQLSTREPSFLCIEKLSVVFCQTSIASLFETSTTRCASVKTGRETVEIIFVSFWKKVIVSVVFPASFGVRLSEVIALPENEFPISEERGGREIFAVLSTFICQLLVSIAFPHTSCNITERLSEKSFIRIFGKVTASLSG